MITITKVFTVTADIAFPSSIYGTDVIKQNDMNSIIFNIALTDESKVVDLTGASVRIAFGKPDRTTVYQDCTVTNASNGLASVTLDTDSLAVSGMLTAEISISYPNNVVVNTTSFTFVVANSVMSDNALPSMNDYPAFQKAIDAGDTLANVDLQQIVNNTNNVTNLLGRMSTAESEITGTPKFYPFTTSVAVGAVLPGVILEVDVNVTGMDGTIPTTCEVYGAIPSGILVGKNINYTTNNVVLRFYNPTGASITVPNLTLTLYQYVVN